MWRQSSYLTLFRVLFCNMSNAKPLSEIMLTYCQFDTKEQKQSIKIQIHLFIKIARFQHGLIHWHWYWTIVNFFPCLLLITVDMDILIKAWGRCHKDHHKWKRSDSPCNTGCITVFFTRFKHMWPRAVNKVGRVIYIAFNWALMRMKRRPVLLFHNQSLAIDDEKMAYIT